MAVSWTTEQKQVIELRKRNILVSAAAGSGKTAVLVERIIKMITDAKNPVDIDHLLIVTFTNAAAAEMRERIGAAIEKALEENPRGEHLQRQLTLIHNAQITTIDSFCLYIIRNHFHEIDLEPNFRIGDEGELKLLKEDVLKAVLERNYEESLPEFTALVEGYAPGRSDEALNGMILSLYEFSRSYPWPTEWLTQCGRGYAVTDAASLEHADFMRPFVENIRMVVRDMADRMRQALDLTLDDDGPQMYEKVIRSDLEKYEKLGEAGGYCDFYEALRRISFDRLPTSRGFEGAAWKLEKVKEIRNQAKDVVKKLNSQYFYCSPGKMSEQLNKTEPMAKELVRLTLEFAEAFAGEKKKKNLVDFHDLEHFALEILVDSDTKETRKTAEEFRDTFEEIMIDEYQDSNYVQETILRAVSREARGEHNIFMVGDVKQSIYCFRLARPELFMEKYDSYSLSESEKQRIDLHKNFRSRDEVLSCTNDIFYKIMRKDLGNVEYDDLAALYPGADYPSCSGGTDLQNEDMDVRNVMTGHEEKGDEQPVENDFETMFAPEILLIDTEDELLAESDDTSGFSEQSSSEQSSYSDKKLLEAKMVSLRIQKLKREQLVTDKETGELRPVKYSDIVILLRSLSGWADQFAAVLNADGIPAHTVSSTGYFSAVEVQTVLSMLRILDNPRQDIPLAAVLRSPIVGMTDEELAKLRLTGRGDFHACVLEKCEELLQKRKSSERAVSPETGRNDSEENAQAKIRPKLCVNGSEEMEGHGPEPLTEKNVESYEEKLYEFYSLYQKLRKLVPDTPIHELIEILLKETGYGNYAAAMPAGERRQANLFMLVEKAIAYENTSYKGLFHFVRYIDELQKYDVDFGEADMVGENEDVVRIMSIHKSKGLEFPVVFVSGLGKQFNRQDVRNRMVLHPELGMGLDCMDGTRRLRTPTIMKKAIAKQIDLENLGEELRVLYVALTRAKEKLILTAGRKNAAEEIEKLRMEAEMIYEDRSTPISYLTREGAKGCLDWLLPALLSYGEKYSPHVVSAAELVIEEIGERVEKVVEKETCVEQILSADIAMVSEYERIFSFQYPNQEDIGRKNKYSVSELKHRAMRERIEQEEEESVPAFLEETIVPYVPAFARRIEEKEETVNQGALRGTAMHRVMECYRFVSEESAAEQVERMFTKGEITQEMRALVKLPMIESFLISDAGQRMKQAEMAGKLYREKPFVMGFTPEELETFGFGEMKSEEEQKEVAMNQSQIETAEFARTESQLTLIQGIIDVFWMEEDGIVLLDYKTDRVDLEKQLMDRYAAQLQLYGEALERIYNESGERKIRVKERLLYSFRLGKLIAV